MGMGGNRWRRQMCDNPEYQGKWDMKDKKDGDCSDFKKSCCPFLSMKMKDCLPDCNEKETKSETGCKTECQTECKTECKEECNDTEMGEMEKCWKKKSDRPCFRRRKCKRERKGLGKQWKRKNWFMKYISDDTGDFYLRKKSLLHA